jgi:nitrogen regulatory protein P-II 1
MKEIKAYLRPEKVDAVVHALDQAGFGAITLIPVNAVGRMADPEQLQISPAFVQRCSAVCKLEFVCRSEDAENAVRLIVQVGRSGYPGDGAVFVSDIETAVKIRTGDRGLEAVDGAR